MISCNTCHDAKKIQCPKCKGAGTALVCGKTKKCPKCKGAKEITCPDCGKP